MQRQGRRAHRVRWISADQGIDTLSVGPGRPEAAGIIARMLLPLLHAAVRVAALPALAHALVLPPGRAAAALELPSIERIVDYQLRIGV